jgi:hypothetical protein
MRKFVTIILLALVSLSAFGQKADLRRGNRQFRKEKYAEADISYRKALMQDTALVATRYNLANNLYRQGNMDEAAKQMDAVANNAGGTHFAADYYFNRGDVAIAQEDWQKAVESFMECLVRTPDDLAAKENYIYARNKLIEQQQQQQDQDQNQDQNQDQQNQDQNQQNQDQDQNQDQNQNQQDQDKDQQDQNQDQDQQDQNQGGGDARQEEPQLSPQQAQQLLQAIQDKEKKTQEKVEERKALMTRSRKKDKNW